MRRKALVILFVGMGAIFAATTPSAADESRRADVAQRGAEVMPFDLNATTHIFTKTADGGVQRVVAKNRRNVRDVDLIRKHLREIDEQFSRGNYSAPSSIHGNDMPGLTELQSAKPGQVQMAYSDVEGGAQIRYSTRTPTLINAINRWFDAQLSDHGADAMEGHDHSGMQKH